jgi:GIY-YIG catalytic domain
MRREKDHDDSSGICEGYRSAIPYSGAMAARGQNSGSRAIGTRRAEGLANTSYSGKALQRRAKETEAGQTEENKASEIDPCALPYVVMSELNYLPTCSGIYFAIEESGQVAYIGQSVNIRRRWQNHHVQGRLCDLGDLHSARRVKIAWLEIDDTQKLEPLELALIRRFKPRLNKRYARPVISTGQPRQHKNKRQGRNSPEYFLPFPTELEEAAKLCNEAHALARTLIASGYSGEKVNRILDRLFLRCFRRESYFQKVLSESVKTRSV